MKENDFNQIETFLYYLYSVNVENWVAVYLGGDLPRQLLSSFSIDKTL